MLALQEVQFRTGSLKPEQVDELFRSFCDEEECFEFDHKGSKNYARDYDSGGYYINAHGISEFGTARIAIADSGGQRLYTANIVFIKPPHGREPDEAQTIHEQNRIAQCFHVKIKDYFKNIQAGISVSITPEQVDLTHIIRGKKTRAYFDIYLNEYPVSWHASDLANLDRFTCALSRFHCDVDMYLLKRFLMEDRDWSEENASYCIERIETGLDVLKANRTFFRYGPWFQVE